MYIVHKVLNKKNKYPLCHYENCTQCVAISYFDSAFSSWDCRVGVPPRNDDVGAVIASIVLNAWQSHEKDCVVVPLSGTRNDSFTIYFVIKGSKVNLNDK